MVLGNTCARTETEINRPGHREAEGYGKDLSNRKGFPCGHGSLAGRGEDVRYICLQQTPDIVVSDYFQKLEV